MITVIITFSNNYYPTTRLNINIIGHVNTVFHFCRLVSGLLKRAQGFTLAFRSINLTHGHNINNFAEASMRIFKEVILQWYDLSGIAEV